LLISVKIQKDAEKLFNWKRFKRDSILWLVSLYYC